MADLFVPIRLQLAEVTLDGDLELPERAIGIVTFAHGSGSSRHSVRNRALASRLHGNRLGTLLVDLLSEPEEREDEITLGYRFDIGLLTRRMVGICDWLAAQDDTHRLPLGLFGASTGAAAALGAAAERPRRVAAVVSRGGRPDLAGDRLRAVRAPTLLVAGERDEVVIDLNRRAQQKMGGIVTRLEIVPGATHLFEEPGALERVADLAANWFTRYLQPAPDRRAMRV